ncbi:hypothetical protein J0A68_14915 [Algoriphagus sp. H41]|uniref:DUF5689 domain-containing protein n=1 Tax=Algoriphagus oliviformis TaxID=2811231 RepID=A0ABS3C546_9BACT|nr:hypothetical protein [Algoriphagus oliviformis]MBN7812243.1 hypothetical protein [Algoriphagus oliviformis]
MKTILHLFSRPSYLIGLLILAGGCDLIKETFPESDKDGKITCKVDGVEFEAAGKQGSVSIDFVVAEMLREGSSFHLTVWGVSEHNGGALAVGFRMGGYSLADIAPGTTLTDWDYDDALVGDFVGAMGGVEERSSPFADEAVLRASSNHSDLMSLTVDELDTVQKTLSGTFFFKAKDQDTGAEVEVTEGAFSNIQWTEVE